MKSAYGLNVINCKTDNENFYYECDVHRMENRWNMIKLIYCSGFGNACIYVSIRTYDIIVERTYMNNLAKNDNF